MHRRALPLIALLAGCAPLSSDQLAIVGGDPSPDQPAVLSLFWNDAFLCSAVHIGGGRAVTAAHCLYGYIAGDPALTAHWGPDAEGPDALSAVPDFTLHPDFTTDVSADLAFVELAETEGPPVAWNAAPIGEELLGEELLLVGFGRTSADDLGGAVRRQTTVEIGEVAELRIRWTDPAHGICDGDSGGAALLDRGLGVELVGLLVEGAPGCDDWGAALRLDAYRDFLDGDPVLGDDDDDATLDLPGPTGPVQSCSTAGGGGSGLWLLALARRRRR